MGATAGVNSVFAITSSVPGSLNFVSCSQDWPNAALASPSNSNTEDTKRIINSKPAGRPAAGPKPRPTKFKGAPITRGFSRSSPVFRSQIDGAPQFLAGIGGIPG